MDKSGLLKSIATIAYNVGFGAKKHFATFDIVEKAPGWIGLISSAVGILALVYEPLSAKLPSAILVILGICTFYITPYKSKQYDTEGRDLTKLFGELRDLYYAVQSDSDINECREKLNSIEERYYKNGLSKQILFSDWYAHYKFFSQQQIGWLDQQLNFTWKDRIPLSLRVFLAVVFLLTLLIGFLIWRGCVC